MAELLCVAEIRINLHNRTITMIGRRGTSHLRGIANLKTLLSTYDLNEVFKHLILIDLQDLSKFFKFVQLQLI